MRPALCEEALRLGRVVAGLMPNEAEVHGLVALMELHASRTPSRTSPDGEPILLADQNRARWDRLLVRRGLAGLEKAEALSEERGPYTLQAAISACHARALSVEQTDWRRIAELYGELVERTGSPVVELNRAVAVGKAEGPARGLAIADALVGIDSLKGYHLLPTVRGDLLEQLSRFDEAKAEFERAAAMTKNERERRVLLDRAGRVSSRT
jgi:predicted RNA polymerase sigma factor